MPPMRPRRAFLVSHTHWDREWYRTFPEFRVLLVQRVRQVLERLETEPGFRHFVLDGQSIVVEDHLAACPEDRPRVAAQVERGALSVGPWYVLPDELLISAEAHARNLLIGHRVASEVGGAQKVGYMPDSFGHVRQMPQLLRSVGIDSFIYTRGSGAEIDRTGHEFRWRAPDGSEVLAIHQAGGYCNAGGLGLREIWHAHTQRSVEPEVAVSQVGELFETIAPLARTDVWLLNNGCDHFPPQAELPRLLTALRAAFPETQFVHAGFEEYLDELRPAVERLEVLDGELLYGRDQHILSGVWSARMPLKQRNEVSQGLLAAHVEPLCAYTHFLHGRPYPDGLLREAWKELLRNHPHDSICGCSIDAVHRAMLPRFDAVDGTARALLEQELAGLAPTFARRQEDDVHTVLAIANPCPVRRREVVRRWVVLPPVDVPSAALELVDGGGDVVPFARIDEVHLERFWGVDYRRLADGRDQDVQLAVYLERFGDRIVKPGPDPERHDTLLRMEFEAEVPALGHALYRLRPAATGHAPVGCRTAVRVEGDTLDNGQLRVRLRPDGTLDLTDRRDGRHWSGLGRLVDDGDVGDEYDYAPCPEELRVSVEPTDGAVSAVDVGPLAASLEVGAVLRLPEATTPDRRRRSDVRVDCPVRVRVRLEAGSGRVDVEVEVDNRADDHRLRVGFDTGVRTGRLLSEGHFLVHDRPLRPPKGEDWTQPPAGTWPQQGYSAVEADGRGLALLNRGLPEIEASAGDDGEVRLELTLLRCVGWLSRDDFDTRRRTNAGPTLYTPEAQCRGRHHFRYALLPYVGDRIEADLQGRSDAYRTPLVAIQGVADGALDGTVGLLERSTKATAVTAVKRCDERDTLIVRLYNLTGEPVRERLVFGVPIVAAWRSDPLERRGPELEPESGRALELELGPHRIETVEVELGAVAPR